MVGVQLEFDDASPIYEQVAAELRREIADGECKPGERLPPARDLAAVLGLNTNTVLRALRVLRDEGIVDFRRGRGVTVTGTAPQRSVVLRAVEDLLRLGRHHGYTKGEIVDLVAHSR
ncbi:MAG TPA: GntR family transcriptional regulator [Acidimicrobiia bacterium]|jgi:GntR family transcriptional regulator